MSRIIGYLIMLLIVVSYGSLKGNCKYNDGVSLAAESDTVCSDQILDSCAADSILDITTLDDFEIVGSNKTVKGMVSKINITLDMVDHSTDAGDLLGKVKGIYFDPYTRNITYLGSKNIVILVDSVPKNEQYIKRMSPDRFDRVTIVHEPTGKYEGYDAVINLHTRPDFEGYEVKLGGIVELIPTQVCGSGHNVLQAYPFADVSLKFKKLTVSASLNYLYSYNAFNEYYKKEYPYNGIVEELLAGDKSDPSNRRRNTAIDSEITADYDIDKHHTLSVLLSFKNAKRRNIIKNDIIQNQYGEEYERFSSYQNDFSDRNTGRFILYYKGNVNNWNLNAHAGTTVIGADIFSNIQRTNNFYLDDKKKSKTRYIYGSVSASSSFFDNKLNLSFEDSFTYGDFHYYDYSSGNLLSKSNELMNTLSAGVNSVLSSNLSIGASAGLDVQRNSSGVISRTYFSPRLLFWTVFQPKPNLGFRLNYEAYKIQTQMFMEQDYGQFVNYLEWEGGNPELAPSVSHALSCSVAFLNLFDFTVSYRYIHNAIYRIASLGYGTLPSGIESYYAKYLWENCSDNDLGANVVFHKNFLHHFYASASASLHFKWLKHKEDKVFKIVPDGNVTFSYVIPNINLRLSYLYTLYLDGLFSPQRYDTGLSDFMSILAEYTIPGINLDIKAAYSPPLHFASGNIVTHFKSKPLISQSNTSLQNITNNRFSISLTWRIKAGKTNKQNHTTNY